MNTKFLKKNAVHLCVVVVVPTTLDNGYLYPYHPIKSYLQNTNYMIWNKCFLKFATWQWLAVNRNDIFGSVMLCRNHWKEAHLGLSKNLDLGLSQNLDYLHPSLCCMIPMFSNVFISKKIIRASFTQLIHIIPSLLSHLKLSLQFTTKSDYIKLSLLPLFLAMWVILMCCKA